MASGVSFSERLAHWDMKGKWIGKFKVDWLFIKDIKNREFRLITIPTEGNKSVTNLRDTQEIPYPQGSKMLQVFKSYRHLYSLLDEFEYYDDEERKRKEEEAIEAPARESFPMGRGAGRGRRRGRGRGRGAPMEKLIVVQEGDKELRAVIPVSTIPGELQPKTQAVPKAA